MTGVVLTRIAHDLLGDLAVPADAYYSVQTALTAACHPSGPSRVY